MIAIFEFRINHRRNALLCVLKGKFKMDEATAYVEKFKAACDQMQPDYVVISDLREFIPAKEDVMEKLKSGSEYSVQTNSGQAFRIVNKSVGSQISNLAMNKTARQLGYEVIVVNSMREVQQIMGWV